jgi:serine protease Do
MKNRKPIIAAILLFLGFFLAGIFFYSLINTKQPNVIFPPKVPAEIMETTKAFSEIANSVSPFVVNISTTKVVKRDSPSFFEDFFDTFREYNLPKKWKEQNLGSGVIVSKEGFIVTNYHVVEKAEEIRVILYDKRSFRGEVVGFDQKTDIALIKISATDLPTLLWGDSDKLRVGEFVLAIGNPFGLSHTVTMGIVSAIGRVSVGISDYEDFIQTDAAINPGNSGGPLVNIKGEVIGINTAIFSRTGGYQGIGFAVPSNLVQSIVDQLVKYGKVMRGWLGITIQNLTAELSQKFNLKDTNGALVTEILKGSPADKAGLVRGDVITEFNGKKVADADNLRNMIAQSNVGSQVLIKMYRAGKEYQLNAPITEYPREPGSTLETAPPPTEAKREALSGIEVVELTKEIARQLGLEKDEKGVVIERIEPGSSADEARLRRGDVIQEIERMKITSVKDFNKIASNIKPGDTVLLLISRSGRKIYIVIKAS